ncbi:MAG TPA: O-antigen ligase family protein [Bryobacteraceae bacterium]|jgi:O-antigen ligase
MLFLIAVPLWLFGVIFPPTVESESLVLVQFAAFAWFPIAAVFSSRGRFLFGPAFREQPWTVALAGASIVAITASAALSEDPTLSLGFVATVAIGLVCCAGVWEMGREKIATSLWVYSVLGTALIGYVYWVGARVQGRLTIGDAHPNYLGLISFGFLMCAPALPKRGIAAILIAANLYIIVETQSRSALAASILGLFVFASLKAKQMKKGRAAFTLACVALLSTVLLLVYYDTIETWVSSLFFLNDRYRGLGTGFTGRIDAWQEALDLFQQNPLFGVGFRMHERYMTTLSSAHNGYLSLLAEVGIFGTIPLIGLAILGGYRLFRRAWSGDEMAIMGFAFFAGYALLVVFERLFLNMGNPTSILAWIFLMIGAPRSAAARTPLQSVAKVQGRYENAQALRGAF